MPTSRSHRAPRVRVLTVAPSAQADKDSVLTIYSQGTSLSYQLGKYSVGKEDAIIESLKGFPPGSLVTLWDSKGQSVSWTAETFDFRQSLNPARCDVQFTQYCLLGTKGIASWWLRFVPSQFSSDKARVGLYARADDSFGDDPQGKTFCASGDGREACAPWLELSDLSTGPFFENSPMRVRVLNDPGAHGNTQSFKFFSTSVSSEIVLDLVSSGVGKTYELRYTASKQPITSSVGNGIDLKNEVVNLSQPTTYIYTSNAYRSLRFGVSGIRTKTMLACWNQNVAQRYLRSLALNQLFSALPILDYSGSNVPWEVQFSLTSTQPLTTDGNRFTWIALDAEGPDQFVETKVGLGNPCIMARVRGINLLAQDRNSPPALSRVSATLPMLLTQDGKPVKFDNLSLSTKPASNNLGWQVSLAADASNQSVQTVRVGAFELDFPTAAVSTSSQNNNFVITCNADYGVTAVSATRSPLIPQIIVAVAPLPLVAVRPASEDDLVADQYSPLDQEIDPGNRGTQHQIQTNLQRETAVVFSLDTPSDTTGAASARKWSLLYTEESVREKKQTVHMTLGYTAPADSIPSQHDESVLVLDRNPFTVAEVHFHPLSDTGGKFSVAEWSSQTGAWTIQQTADKPSYLLMPPQITGEEVVTDDNSYPQGIDDQKLPRLLLGSPTAITYAPDNLRNFVEVPWNLRRLLTDQSLRVSRIDYEMLYGMSCHTTAPQMRLTEASTLYGLIRPGLPSVPLGLVFVEDDDKKSYLNTRLYWSRLYREYQSRLGIFVTEDPTNTKDPSDFRDATYTACELRLDDWKPLNDNSVIDRYLTPSEVSHDYAHPNFKGGALAGVNQPDIFTGIVSNRTSHVGHAAVLDPRFSALGGFGTTQASFDNDRSTLINTISMGRTITYSVERIGRIACFWNRAKHVIVYQRTVVPSRQFYLSQEKSKFAGRPLVRKVEEYIEFLQEERVFANESPAPLTSYVKGFKCGEKKRFNVNSTWGSSVPGKGWKVPLWNSADASILPDVYPKPQVFVEVSTPERKAGSSAEQPSYTTHDCLLTQPQEVFFFTSTGAGDTADTDKWAPVDSVDCVGYPLCWPETSIYDSGNLGNAPQPEFSIPPGWEPVTFTIAPAPAGVHVTDGIIQQNDSPLAANIKTITFSRGAASQRKTLAALGLDPSYGQGSSAIAAMKSGFSDLRNLITAQSQNPTSQAVDAIKAKLGALQNNSAQLAQVATNLINKASIAATQSFQQAVQSLQNQFATNVAGVKKNVQSIIDAASNPSSLNQQFVTEFQRITDMIQSVATEAANWTASNSRTQLDQAVQAWSAELEQSIGSITPLKSVTVAFERARKTITSLQAAVGEISAQASAADIDSRLRPIFQQYSDVVSGLNRELTILQASTPTFDPSVVLQALNVDSLQNQFESVLQAASQSLLAGVTASLSQGLTDVKNGINQLSTTLGGFTSSASWAKVDLLSQANLIQQLYGVTPLSDLQAKIRNLTAKDLLASVLAADTSSIVSANQQIVAQIASSISTWMQSQTTGISQTLAKVASLTVDPAKLQELQNSLDQCSTTVAAAAQAVDQNVRQQVAALYNAAAPVTAAATLVRAFGEPPQVPHLDIQPPAIAYAYDWAASQLPITPILARANQVGQALNALGVNAPAIRLDQVLVPPDLSKFDLNAIFSNFAGLNLKNLFSGIKLPSLSEQQFKVTHGWEPQARRAWLQADINAPIPQRLVVFQAGAFAFSVKDSTFKATCRIQNDGTNVQQRINGSIGGTLSLEIGDSSSLINFLDAALNFDDSGKLQFQFNPAKIKLADALQAVSALINTLSGDSKSGFTYGPTPNGVKCAFALPIPDTSALTSGISALSFATSLELAALGDNFDITVTLGISSKNRPFNFAIFILGGCGYVQTGVTYHVSQGKFDALQLDLAIGCSASLAIGLGGIISGGVYAQFAIELKNSGSGFLAVAFFQISGHVSLLGIVSIDIVLRLEASYAGGVMNASGHVEYEVKMFMFSISVSKDVSMSLGSGGQRSSLEFSDPMRNQIAFLSGPNGSTRSIAEAFAAADAATTTTPAYRYVTMLI